jgi:3-hydroxybutyryl-CoA dehydrogenase
VIGITGAGTMGVGIAAALAGAGQSILLFEPDARVRAEAADRLAGAGRIDILDRLDELATAGLVIEAAPEDVKIKHALYTDLFACLAPDAIVASNTSSILPDDLAAGLVDDMAARFLVAHFWNPPPLLPLVELVPGTRTAPATVESVRALLADARLKPVVLGRAVPGFIGNRLQFAMLREALALVESGVATPEAIDEVVRYSLGRRYAATGPIESADLGGLHVFLAIARRLFPDLAGADEGVASLAALVEAGRTGSRSGSGFYEWTKARYADVARRRQVVADRAAASA